VLQQLAQGEVIRVNGLCCCVGRHGREHKLWQAILALVGYKELWQGIPPLQAVCEVLPHSSSGWAIHQHMQLIPNCIPATFATQALLKWNCMALQQGVVMHWYVGIPRQRAQPNIAHCWVRARQAQQRWG
jgi:hypothetical protein